MKTSHPYVQGLRLGARDGVLEPVCVVCGGLAVDHGTKPAVFGHVPVPVVVVEVVKELEDYVVVPGWKRVWKWLSETREGGRSEGF